jgi:alkylated DNA repair dioxygenase AlkB
LPEFPELPNGLRYLPSFIKQDEAEELVAFIDAQVWDTGMKRRVQHYGWLYDYKASRVSPESFLGPLPGVFAEMVTRISDGIGETINFDQVIVNEYVPGQGISAHVDCLPCFGPVVAAISLGSTCEMLFQNMATKAQCSLLLEPLSLLVLAGEARKAWSHAIPARRSDVFRGTRLARNRRVSLTFRNKT